MRARFFPAAGSAVVLTCLVAAPAHGQNAPASNPQALSSELAEVVVTAEKVTEVASKTPLSLSSFTDEQLMNNGVVSVDELGNIAPAVNVGTASHGANVSIRGVSTTDVTSKGQQAVAFTIDGMDIGRPQIMGLSFFDLERVEVLRGPQGTLYGKSSTAGAINVITAKPKMAFDAYAAVEYGDYNTRRAEAMVNLPVTDTFAVRMAANYNVRDGYLDPVLHFGSALTLSGTQRPLDDEDNTNGRLSALWLYADSGSLLVQATAGSVGGTGDASGYALFNRYDDGGSYAREVYYNPMAGGVDDHYNKINVELNQDWGPVHLAYTGGRLAFRGDDDYNPSTGEPQGTNPTYNWSDYISHDTYNSHEIRLSNVSKQRLEYVVGANYWKEDINEIDNNWQTFVSPNATTTPACPAAAPNLLPGCNVPNPDIVGLTQSESKGAFGQINFHATDALKVILGARYSSDSMFRHSTFAVGPTPATGWLDANGNLCYPGDPCVPYNANGTIDKNDYGSESSGKATWRVGLDYEFLTDQMVYGYIATGYKAGSFNDVNPSDPAKGAEPYGPESMTAYEVGYKGKIWPNFEITTAAYYYDYSKFQLTGITFLAPNLSGGAPVGIIFTHVVPVELYGWEGEMHWRPTAGDLLDLNLAVENGFFRGGANHATAGIDYLDQIDWSGKRLDNLPPLSALVSYEHRFALADGGFISARVSSKISGGYYETDFAGEVNGPPFAPAGTPYGLPPTQYYQRSYTRTDLNIGYTSASGKFLLNAYVRNIEDKMQLQGPPLGLATGNINTDQVTVPINAPRTMGVRMTVRF